MRCCPLMQASRLLSVVFAVALALANASCGRLATSPPDTSQARDQTVDLRSAGTVLIMYCGSTRRPDSLSSVRSLALTALSVDNGREVATETVSMPGRAIDGGPSFVCGDPHGGYYPSAPVLSQLFNRDYTQIAGWVRGRGGEGDLATAFDLRTGAQVGPGPNPNTFAAAPDDGRAIFHEGKLWYVDRGKHLRSRAPREAPEVAQDHGPVPSSKLIFEGNNPWYGNNKFSSAAFYTAVVHPSGRYAAELDQFWGNLRIRQRGAENYNGSALSEGTAAGAKEPPPGSARTPSCSPNFWLDDHTLICTSRSQIWKLMLASNLESVTNAEPLLPATDRRTYGAIPAPDKLSFAFLANQGNITTVYRQSLSPGSQPVKIADVPASGSTYLIVWQ